MERLDDQTAPRPATLPPGRPAAASHAGPARPDRPEPGPGYADRPWAAQPAGTGPPVAGPPAGGLEPERPKWSTRRTAAVTAAAAAAVLGVGGVAVAYSGSGSDTAATAPGPGRLAPGAGMVPGGADLASALHGTFVTRGGDGTYVTRVMQTGEVTAVSATSVAVRSADGYARTYALSSSTSVNGGQVAASAIETGHTVTVVASEDGVATSVVDQSLLGGQGGFPGQPPGQAPPGGTVPDGPAGSDGGTT